MRSTIGCAVYMFTTKNYNAYRAFEYNWIILNLQVQNIMKTQLNLVHSLKAPFSFARMKKFILKSYCNTRNKGLNGNCI